mgnify:CR=1 FL=1
MSKPVVAIVGRPNVGKSTLFNALAGEMISIVKDTPGVTRDRIYADVTWLDKSFTLIDTGGIEPDSGDIILSQMREQAQIAIDTADVIVFITDVQQGLVDSDAKVADMLRRSQKPVVLVVNKVDSVQKYMMDVYEFYNLGIGEPIAISAANRTGIGDMLDEIVKEFPEDADTDEDEDIPKIAVVGKPNVGKSSLINKLLGEDRVIVSDIAGTTRDVLEEQMNLNGITLNIIDTAGIRDTEDIVEKIGVNKAKDYLVNADLIIYVVDSSTPLDENDEKIMEMIKDRTALVLLNKSDLDTVTTEEMIASHLDQKIIKVSMKENQGVDELENAIKELFFHGKVELNDEVYITNARHKAALSNAKDSLNMVLDSIAMEMPEDFYSIDLMNTYEELGNILGESLGEDLVNEIFSKFCTGK